MKQIVGALVVIALFVAGAVAVETCDQERRDARARVRLKTAEVVCRNHAGVLAVHRVKVGFGAFHNLALCNDATEVRLP